MPDTLPAGPYRTIQIDNGQQAPFYILPFDEQGLCQGPLTQAQLLSTVQVDTYTDIFLFSHGWNNDWNDASSNYNNFLSGYMKLRHDHGLTYGRPFRPLMIGIFWPSIALLMPSENAPAFAGNLPQLTDMQVALNLQEVQSLATAIAKEDVERFYALAQRGQDLKPDEALELARIMAPIYHASSDELPDKGPAPSPADIVKMWQTIARMTPSSNTSGAFGFADEPTGAPEAAGAFNFPDPREIIRAATVLQMKDRAGVVGAHGVCSLLHDLLANSGSAYLHLVGHSYGCKVLLSALCFQDVPRPVHSILLLEPAISYLCFAKDATGTGQPGGYRSALQKVEDPILLTFSSHDIPLTQLFHLAVRRPSDLGEMQIAGAPPSRYAALGGYGPGGVDNESKEISIKNVGDP
ncbi:MAG TPA: hypothetical protein VIY29_27605, partial [Ktedonobacteraceae bacterium]